MGPKQAGRCLRCLRDCFEVLEVFTEGPLMGHPRRLGPMLECGTEVRFLLSDGTEATVTFCLDCATALRPADYGAVWRACADRNLLVLRLAERSDSVLRAEARRLMALWPIACLGRRRHTPDGLLTVDRR